MAHMKTLPAQGLGFAAAGLAAFGMWIAVRATWVLAHGGMQDFGGAFRYPRWSVLHFVPALLFAAILPFQLSPRVRNAYPRVHRVAGRVAAVSGATLAAAGLVLPFVMPARPLGERVFMTTFGGVFLLMLWRGIAAARRGDYATHRTWMLRVTASALSPVMQRVVFPFLAAAGIDSMARFWDLFLTAAWLATAINLTVAEWWIRHTSTSRRELHWDALRDEPALERVVQ